MNFLVENFNFIGKRNFKNYSRIIICIQIRGYSLEFSGKLFVMVIEKPVKTFWLNIKLEKISFYKKDLRETRESDVNMLFDRFLFNVFIKTDFDGW